MPENTFTHKINGTTYIITVKSAENATETFEEKMRKLIEETVLDIARGKEGADFAELLSCCS